MPASQQLPWISHPAVRIAGAAVVVATVALSVSLLLGPTETDTIQTFIAPAPSPIEVEYPEYPGAPLLQTAAAAAPAEPRASIAPAAVAIARQETARPPDSPPRRIGPPIAVATLGSTAEKNGRVVLLLEVTEDGHVARVLSREGVDAPPDAIASVATAARAWRYEPARRDGVAVPARVRVVVQLNGAGN